MKPANCTELNHEDDDKHEEIKWFINVEIYSLWKNEIVDQLCSVIKRPDIFL